MSSGAGVCILDSIQRGFSFCGATVLAKECKSQIRDPSGTMDRPVVTSNSSGSVPMDREPERASRPCHPFSSHGSWRR